MPLEPQAALEQAVVNAIAAAGLGYVDAQTIARTLDGRPHPRCGQVFVSVWSEGDRESNSRSCLDERFGVIVTVTARLGGQPFDRQVVVRDDVERRLNAIRTLVHKDTYDHAVINAASVLAALETDTVPDVTKKIGFREALTFLGYDRWQLVGPEWFWATGTKDAGIAQSARFGKARRVQALATMG